MISHTLESDKKQSILNVHKKDHILSVMEVMEIMPRKGKIVLRTDVDRFFPESLKSISLCLFAQSCPYSRTSQVMPDYFMVNDKVFNLSGKQRIFVFISDLERQMSNSMYLNI